MRRLPSCCRSRVIDLSQTYRHLGRPWTHEELAVRYAAANRRGEQLLSEARTPRRSGRSPSSRPRSRPPPRSASPSTSFTPYPTASRAKLADELLATAETNAADALHRCHRALELDGHAHSYTADEWLPVIYDIAGPLLESSRLDPEPPSLVRHAQDAVRWLSTSIACLDEDSRETSAALADTLARLLVVCVFADAARTRSESRVE